MSELNVQQLLINSKIIVFDCIHWCIYNGVYNIRSIVMSKLPSYIKKAKSDYRKRITTITVTINPKTEPEIYKRVNDQENKSGYIKSLIERDIKGGDHGC